MADAIWNGKKCGLRNVEPIHLDLRNGRERGATLMEAALVLPLFFLLLLAIFEFGLIYSSYQTMVGAAREGARQAVGPNGYYPTLPLPSDAQIASTVCSQIQAGVFGIGQIAACTAGGSPASLATGSCPSASVPPPSLTSENVYIGQCTVPVPLPYNCKTQTVPPSCGVETYKEVAVHRTVQLFWGWKIPLTAYAVMRSEAN